MGAEVRLVGFSPASLLVKGCHLLVLFLMAALSWACGSDALCPSGTGGEQCLPNDDLGAAPEVPEGTTNRAYDDLLEADILDSEDSDAEGSFETETTTQFLREVPDVRPLTSPFPKERDVWLVMRSDHATDIERAIECMAQPGKHVDSRGAPRWCSFFHVEHDRGLPRRLNAA